MSAEQGVDFDKDLARLNQIRASHRSARPTSQNPAWLNTHADCAFLLGFIDSLWRAYTNDANSGGLLEPLKLASHELERYVDLQTILGYIEYAADTQSKLDVVNAAIARVTS